ncbi:MAG: sulfotransferase family 2 domain-containing protein [Pseudomonadales bacterium]
MIVAHSRRFVFFAVPKTASQSIRAALQPVLSAQDWQQHARYGQAYLPVPVLAALGHGHISVQQLATVLPAELLAAYWKFAIVRNPFDRFVSACCFLFRGDDAFQRMPAATMRQALNRPRFRSRILIRPQTDLLMRMDGRLGVDFAGRYENLCDAYGVIARRTGSARVLPWLNAHAHLPYQRYYDDRLHAMVSDFYARDLAQFDYQFEAQAAGCQPG